MARIRTVKPEIWTDERVGECSIPARLLFIATWNFADDHGGLDRSAKQLKAQAFPYDNIDCEPLVQELLNAGLLVEYESGGKKYLHIRGFRKHQKNEKPAAPRFPLYSGEDTPSASGAPDASSGGAGGSSGATAASDGGTERSGGSSSSLGMIKEGKITQDARATAGSAGDFAKLKAAYPEGTYRQSEWLLAERDVEHHLANGHNWPELHAGVERYAVQCRVKASVGTQFVLSPSKFFARGPAPKFLEPYPLPAVRAGPAARLHVPSPTTAELEALEASRAN